MRERHLIGIYLAEGGGNNKAECAECGLPFRGATLGKVQGAVERHYKAQHPEIGLRWQVIPPVR